VRERHRHPEDRVQTIEQSLTKWLFAHARKLEGMLDAGVGGGGKPFCRLLGGGFQAVDQAAHAIVSHSFEVLESGAEVSEILPRGFPKTIKG